MLGAGLIYFVFFFVEQWLKFHQIVERQLDPGDKPFSGMTFILGGRMSRPQVRESGQILWIFPQSGDLTFVETPSWVELLVAPFCNIHFLQIFSVESLPKIWERA